MLDDLDRILFDEATIHRRLDELAARISHDYRDQELTVIAVLNGSVILMADLLRRIPLPLKLDCLSVASYHGGIEPGEPLFRPVPLPDVSGRHVLILDDILDSGGTLSSIREKLEMARPLSVRICVLLERKRSGPGRSNLITWASKSRTSSWSDMVSIIWNAIVISRASASCETI